MHRFLSRLLKRRDREGQGLVEYALILVLVTIVVVAVLTLFGDSVAQMYCGVIFNVDKGAAAKAKACRKPMLTCVVESNVRTAFSFRVDVIDADSPVYNNTAGNYEGNITVRFYINNSSTQAIAPEDNWRYCYPGGNNSPCATTGGPSLNSGDTIRAVATDKDGNTGECSVRVP